MSTESCFLENFSEVVGVLRINFYIFWLFRELRYSALISTDGTEWTEVEIGVNSSLGRVIWNGSLLVAIGGYGNIITSSDGYTWTARDSQTNYLSDIIWNGQQFIALGSKVIAHSSDGINWTVTKLNLSSPYMEKRMWQWEENMLMKIQF